MLYQEYDFTINRFTCPIEGVNGVWEFQRPPFFKYHCHSLSGHLLHYVTEGNYKVKINGREYSVNKGDIIYYYEAEEVETFGNSSSVKFISVSYEAKKLLPTPYEYRVFQATKNLRALFYQLYKNFLSEDVLDRRLMVYSTLLKILKLIEGLRLDFKESGNEDELWWAIERHLRSKKLYQPTINDIIKISGYSKSTIIRSCKKQTGTSPINRIHKIRMEEARSLLSFAHLNVNQVAEYLGYGRINEFSRDFSKHYGEPPRNFLIKIRKQTV